jgi:hypothetical protein
MRGDGYRDMSKLRHRRQCNDETVSDDVRVPIATVLPDFELHPLQEGWVPLQAFVLVKALDEVGESSWAFRTSQPFNPEELLGALTVQVEILRNKLIRNWDDDDDE